MIARITVDRQHPISLTESRYLIGRGDGCEILLPETDGAVSRRHALLECDKLGNWTIVDLGSHNGTRVNGERLTERCTLCDGDCIEIGKSNILLDLPRSQPTVALDTPVIAEMPRSRPTIAVEADTVSSLPISTPARSSMAPTEPETLVQQDVPAYSRPLPSTTRPAYGQTTPAPASLESRQYSEPPPASVPLSASQGMGFIITGVALVIISALAYLVYIEPKMQEYQSVMGQFAGGIMVLLGNNTMQQEYQNLVYERIASIAGGFIGAGLILAGVLKRR